MAFSATDPTVRAELQLGVFSGMVHDLWKCEIDFEFKAIVDPKMKICWGFTKLEVIQDVDGFVSSWE